MMECLHMILDWAERKPWFQLLSITSGYCFVWGFFPDHPMIRLIKEAVALACALLVTGIFLRRRLQIRRFRREMDDIWERMSR